jgi:protein TonB
MENENAIKNFDDLVFENRNKTYGAYAIRKSYNDNVNKAAMIALLSSGVLVVFTILISSGKEIVENITVTEKICKLDIIPVIDPAVKPPKQNLPKQHKAVTTPTQVTTETVIEEPKIENPPQETNVEGSETGHDIFVEGKATEENTVVAAVAPVPAKPRIFTHVEFMPQFTGGETAMIRFIQRTFHYPAVARRMNIEGTVYVSFVIDADGNVTMINVDKGVSKECDEEAIRIIEKMPKWIAGRQGNMPVSVRQCLPIKFTLNHDL